MGEWTSEKIAELARLWAEGWTASQIGKRLGTTKNAVIGKAHRLGLPSRPNPSQRTYNPALSREERLERQREKYRANAAPACAPTLRVIPRLRLDPVLTCQTIMSREGWHSTMCAKPAVLGKSWCPECYRRFTLPVPVKAREAA